MSTFLKHLQDKVFIRNYFIQRVVYPNELPSIMRKHTLTGAMGGIWSSLISGIFFVFFGTTVGISRFEWGVMAAISSWLIAAQPLSALIINRIGRRKMMWFWFAILDRIMRIIGILVAYRLYLTSQPFAGTVLIVAICSANLFGMMANPAWLSWLADIIPEKEHGTFWGRRAAWIAVTTVGVVVPAAYVQDHIPEEGKLAAVVIVFIAASVIGILDIIIHGTIPEPAMVRPDSGVKVFDQFLEPIRDRRFRRWIVFNFTWTISMSLGGSLSTVYFIEELGIRNNLLGGMIASTSFSLIGSIITGAWSGKLVDRIGIRKVLLWGHAFWGLIPFCWLVATKDTALFWLGLSNIIGGTSSTAAANAANKLITRFPPAGSRAMYAAVSTSIGSIAAGLGAFLAGGFLGLLGNDPIVLAGFSVVPFQVLFLLSFLGRSLSAQLLIRRIEELA